MTTVKVSEATYRRLNELAGELRARTGKPVSLDEAMDYLIKEKRSKPCDYAGAWVLSEEEEKEIFRELGEFWRKSKFRTK